MRNAEEFSGQRSGLARVLPAYCRPRSAAGGQPGTVRIRYAHHGALPGDEPFRAGPQGPADYHGTDEGTGDVRDLADGGGYGNGGGEGWLTEFPAGKRHGDLWVLVCGGIAAAAAFAAAFVASGGVASHPAAPGAGVPAVVSQACPAPAASPVP
jgi:hypothetical protein